ncbi:hypothetical protein, partial [Nocardioides sp.]|uniref:hypothetical protein n=1 Tax=Nocardioides sp. TaxID=35761 RepID=UPI002ED95EA7
MPAGPRLARRSAIALVAGPLAGLVAVSGCDDDHPSPAGSPTATSAPDPDVALVDGVLDELGQALRLA